MASTSFGWQEPWRDSSRERIHGACDRGRPSPAPVCAMSLERGAHRGWQSLEMDAAAPGTAEAHDIVAALLVRNGRVLLCHRSAGRRWYPDVWDLPGGHVEDEEPPIEALARELEEELGILIQQPGPELARVVEPEFALRIWLVEKWVGDPVNASPEEHDDLGWFDLSEVSSLSLAHSGYLSLIQDTIARLGL
jgi:8-oxo-dGTP diphosphatase